jgi:hypothetical protein
MINKYTKVFSLAALLAAGVLTLSSTSSAYALIDLNVGGSASSSNQTSGSINNTKLELNGNVGAGASASSSSVTNDSSSGSSGNASGGVESTLDLSSDLIQGGSSLDVTHDEVVSASEEADFSGEEEMDSGSVTTNADLKAYAHSAIRADDQVEGMRFTGETVEVKYKEQGRFLALLPVTFTVEAVTHADGTVEVKYPWYSFLTVDNHDKVETELKVAIDSVLRSRMVGSVQAEGSGAHSSFTAAESAAVASQMQKVLNANLTSRTTTQTGE